MRFVWSIVLALVCCCASIGTAQAQICQGSLGDPIVNIDFGRGPNPGPPLSAATTNYSYVSTDCPGDGKYAVRNRTDSCFDNLWFPIRDRSGDAEGYFMLVNASYEPGHFYLDTVRGLCGGSTYEFAAWLINVSRPIVCWGATSFIMPNITFRIERTDGTLIQSYNTGDIPASDPPVWKQYGFFFTTPPGVGEVVLRMVNNAPGGCGNDVALDDITFRPCGPQVSSTISGMARQSDTLCLGSTRNYQFEAQVSAGYQQPEYQWQQSQDGQNWTDIAGANTTTYQTSFGSTAAAGDYFFRLLVAESGNMGSPNCRVASRPLNIHILQPPVITASSNSPVCMGGVIQLNATGNDISWSGPNNFSATGNQVTIEDAADIHAGDYVASSAYAFCTLTDTVSVMVSGKPAVTVTPDTAVICEGDSVMLQASGAAAYSWSATVHANNETGSSVTVAPVTTTTYRVIGSEGGDCVDTAYALVQVIRAPKAHAGQDVSVMQGSTVRLNGTARGDQISYQWSPEYEMVGSQTLSPVVTARTDTFYVLTVHSQAGCGMHSDTVRIRIFQNIVVPNAFSPNNDLINDRWTINGINSYPSAEVMVFDRYGNEVFRSRNYQPWDGTRNGKPVPVGTYYYLIDLRNGGPRMTGYVYIAR